MHHLGPRSKSICLTWLQKKKIRDFEDEGGRDAINNRSKFSERYQKITVKKRLSRKSFKMRKLKRNSENRSPLAEFGKF